MAGRLSRTEKRFLNPDELGIYKHLRRKYLRLMARSAIAVMGLFLLLMVGIKTSDRMNVGHFHAMYRRSYPRELYPIRPVSYAAYRNAAVIKWREHVALYTIVGLALLIPGALAMAHVPIPIGGRGDDSTPWEDYILYRIRPVAKDRRVNTMRAPYPPSPLIDRAEALKVGEGFPAKADSVRDFFVGLWKSVFIFVMLLLAYVTSGVMLAGLAGLREKAERHG